MATRLTFVCHGSTVATRKTAFPLDEPLETHAFDAAAGLAARLQLPAGRTVLTSPAKRCRQTADLLGPVPAVELGLADWDLGDWVGRTLDDLAAVAPNDVRIWITDPRARPHGGEPLTGLIDRVGQWMDGQTSRLVAVTHPAVIRAAIVHTLRAPADSFWRIDIAPLSVVEVRGRTGTWSLHP